MPKLNALLHLFQTILLMRKKAEFKNMSAFLID